MKKLLSIFLVVIVFTGLVNAQSKMALNIGPLISLPMGDFGDGANLGFGGTAIFEMEFMSQLTGTLQSGYLTWGTDVDDVSFSAIPILVGGKYYFVHNVGFYGQAQLGVSLFSTETPEITIPGFGTIGGGSSSSTEFTFALGAGYEVPVSSNFIVDVSGAFNIISNANHISFRVGGKFGL